MRSKLLLYSVYTYIFSILGGILLSQQQNEESVELLVNKKGVYFRAKVDGVSYEEVTHGNFLNNRWHTVFLQYSLGNLTMNVDGEVQVGFLGSFYSF